MTIRCLGWTPAGGKRVHSDARILGTKAPLENKAVTDGMCDECARAMDATLDAKNFQVIAYADGKRIAKTFDFASATSRLSWLLNHLPNRRGFAFLRLPA